MKTQSFAWFAFSVGIAFMILIFVVVISYLQRSPVGVGMLQRSIPSALPSPELARNLESSNMDLVRESLAVLTERRDLIAIQQALPLLQSQDDYVWLNAAEYLGSAGRVEAVPYLIKAFRHTAWRSDPETLAYLQHITGQTLPADFRAWTNWWEPVHANETFDFDSHLGPMPRK